jgi:hypothetical protein
LPMETNWERMDRSYLRMKGENADDKTARKPFEGIARSGLRFCGASTF